MLSQCGTGSRRSALRLLTATESRLRSISQPTRSALAKSQSQKPNFRLWRKLTHSQSFAVRAVTLYAALFSSTVIRDALPAESTIVGQDYTTTSIADETLHRVIQVGNRAHNQVYFSFERGGAGCNFSGSAFSFGNLVFARHGINLRLWLTSKDDISVKTLIDEATREAVGLIQMPGCVYELRVQRSMDRQGLRLTSSPTLPSAIHDWEDKEVRLRWSEGNTSPGELFFLFAGEPNDVCPERFGNVDVFRNSIDAVARHELASATTDVFSVKKGHCEYLIKVKQYASSEGGYLLAQKVRDVAAYERRNE